jgi:uncharacterized protein (TIGR00251 family)
MRLAVRVTPKGGRDGVDGWALDGEGRPYLKVRVSAPPSDGAANAAVVALLAKTLKRPKSALSIVSGESARLKLLEIEGVDEAAAHAVLGPPPQP